MGDETQDEHQPDECPKEFPCGSLGVLRFPLTQSSRPDCGLLRVDCDAKPYPRIESGGKAYDAKSYDGSSILLLDPNLRNFLDTKSCQFSRNFSSIRKSFQTTLSITYLRTPVQTLFNCSDKKTVDGYQSYGCGEGFTVHYRDPYTINLPQDKVYKYSYKPPPNCSFIQFPAQDEADDNVAGEKIFTLTSEFQLTWSLTADCAKCFGSGGRCLTETETNEFNCLVSIGTKGLVVGGLPRAWKSGSVSTMGSTMSAWVIRGFFEEFIMEVV
nr:LEAF RUST 10 DISEASE-RESISTANCE LOCUS RECEPTOR-LIKE PROTEIN KINASE-like 1.1 [Ipomoea batatas]